MSNEANVPLSSLEASLLHSQNMKAIFDVASMQDGWSRYGHKLSEKVKQEKNAIFNLNTRRVRNQVEMAKHENLLEKYQMAAMQRSMSNAHCEAIYHNYYARKKFLNHATSTMMQAREHVMSSYPDKTFLRIKEQTFVLPNIVDKLIPEEEEMQQMESTETADSQDDIIGRIDAEQKAAAMGKGGAPTASGTSQAQPSNGGISASFSVDDTNIPSTLDYETCWGRQKIGRNLVSAANNLTDDDLDIDSRQEDIYDMIQKLQLMEMGFRQVQRSERDRVLLQTTAVESILNVFTYIKSISTSVQAEGQGALWNVLFWHALKALRVVLESRTAPDNEREHDRKDKHVKVVRTSSQPLGSLSTLSEESSDMKDIRVTPLNIRITPKAFDFDRGAKKKEAFRRDDQGGQTKTDYEEVLATEITYWLQYTLKVKMGSIAPQGSGYSALECQVSPFFHGMGNHYVHLLLHNANCLLSLRVAAMTDGRCNSNIFQLAQSMFSNDDYEDGDGDGCGDNGGLRSARTRPHTHIKHGQHKPMIDYSKYVTLTRTDEVIYIHTFMYIYTYLN